MSSLISVKQPRVEVCRRDHVTGADFKQGDGDITLRPQRADLPSDGERRRRLPRPCGWAIARRRALTPTTSWTRASSTTWHRSTSRLNARRLHFRLEAVKTCAFAPPALVGPIPFADLRAMHAQAETALQAFTPDEVNGWSGKSLDFQLFFGDLAFDAGDVLPLILAANFHFHAVTADNPAHAGRAARQARLRGPVAHQAGLAWRFANECAAQ